MPVFLLKELVVATCAQDMGKHKDNIDPLWMQEHFASVRTMSCRDYQDVTETIHNYEKIKLFYFVVAANPLDICAFALKNKCY